MDVFWAVWLVVIIALFVGIRILQNPRFLGWFGERRVRKELERFIDPNECVVMHDILLPDGRGGTTQIDHLLLAKEGIYVLETKHYTVGRYYGGERGEWTLYPVGKRGKGWKVANPLRQNKGHAIAISKLLGIKERDITQLVVFSGGAEINTKSPKAVNVRKLEERITELVVKNGREFSWKRVKGFQDKIMEGQLGNSRENKNRHIEYVNELHDSRRKQ